MGIRPKERRRVDTIYNMVASAVFHLGDHVRKSRRSGTISEEEVSKIAATIDSLNVLLDVEEPWTFVISDPQGVSELKPSLGAHIGPLVSGRGEAGEAPLSSAAEESDTNAGTRPET